MTDHEGYQVQLVDGHHANMIIRIFHEIVEGPREAMALVAVIIAKLNREPYRNGPTPSNEELAQELLVTLNSITPTSRQ